MEIRGGGGGGGGEQNQEGGRWVETEGPTLQKSRTTCLKSSLKSEI